MKNNIKHITIFTFIAIVVLMIFKVTVYAANDSAVSISSNIDINENKNSTIEAKLNISMMNMQKGINAYTGILKYNKSQLKLVEIEGVNGWNSPIYKDENGAAKVAATNNTFTNKSGAVFIAKFEKISETNDFDISFESLEAAAKLNGKTIKVVEGEERNNEEEPGVVENTATNSEKIVKIIDVTANKQDGTKAVIAKANNQKETKAVNSNATNAQKETKVVNEKTPDNQKETKAVNETPADNQNKTKQVNETPADNQNKTKQVNEVDTENKNEQSTQNKGLNINDTPQEANEVKKLITICITITCIIIVLILCVAFGFYQKKHNRNEEGR